MKFAHSYPSSNGIDFTNSKLPRDFRNATSVVKRHLTTKGHTDAVKWDNEVKAQKENDIRQSREAGMTLGRMVYSDIKRGRPLSDYTENVFIASKNGAKVGDLNHSSYFPDLFRENCAAVLDLRLKTKLQTALICSGQKPPVGIMIDKMTQKKRTGQITAIQTLIPEAGPDNMVQVFFIGNPVVRDHTGKGVASAAGQEVKKYCDSSQIVSFGGDGAYFHLNIESELNKELKLSDKTTYIPDILHRIGTAESDTRKDCQFLLDIISAIHQVLNDMKYGKKYENLLQIVEKHPDIKFYKIDSFSTTRFGNYSYLVFLAFFTDIVLVITALENRVLFCGKKKEEITQNDKESAADAKQLLKKISNVSFIGRLSGVIDIYQKVSKLCNQVQKVNLLLWEKHDIVEKCISNLEKAMTDIPKLAKEEASEHWPIFSATWPKLKNNSLIKNLPYLEEDCVEAYMTRRQALIQQQQNAQPPLKRICQDLEQYINTLISNLKLRLLSNPYELALKNHVKTLTDLNLLKNYPLHNGENYFVTRALKDIDVVSSITALVDTEVPDEEIQRQFKIFLTRVFPLLQAENFRSKETLNKFMLDPALFDGIPDMMHAINVAVMTAPNESVVESQGSILKHHFPSNRNITLTHLEQEVKIHWNGPSLPHCDDIVKLTLDRIQGSNQWHFVRSSAVNRLKFYRISEAVDTYVKACDPFYL